MASRIEGNVAGDVVRTKPFTAASLISKKRERKSSVLTTSPKRLLFIADRWERYRQCMVWVFFTIRPRYHAENPTSPEDWFMSLPSAYWIRSSDRDLPRASRSPEPLDASAHHHNAIPFSQLGSVRFPAILYIPCPTRPFSIPLSKSKPIIWAGVVRS